MSKILIVPVGRYANSGAVAQAVAATLPDAAVFNPLADAERAERLLSEGKGDDWLDLLVGEVGALPQQNVVIQGIQPDADNLLLSSQNVELALSFNAAVVFAVSGDHSAESARRVAAAKQTFAGRDVVFAGVVADNPKPPNW